MPKQLMRKNEYLFKERIAKLDREDLEDYCYKQSKQIDYIIVGAMIIWYITLIISIAFYYIAFDEYKPDAELLANKLCSSQYNESMVKYYPAFNEDWATIICESKIITIIKNYKGE